MKKLISLFVTCTMFILCCSFAFAAPADPPLAEITTDAVDRAVTESLFVSYYSTIIKNTNSLTINAYTGCVNSVTKCGFTYVKLQRVINGQWMDYTSYCYYDQYSNSNTNTFTQTVTPSHGYYYRVLTEHYAEKPYLIVFKTTETASSFSPQIYY